MPDPHRRTPLVLTSINTVMFVAGAAPPDSRRSDESIRDIGEEEQRRRWGAAPQPFGRRGVVVDLFVARRRRCHDIASFSLLDLASQAPSANIIVFMKGSTKRGNLPQVCSRVQGWTRFVSALCASYRLTRKIEVDHSYLAKEIQTVIVVVNLVNLLSTKE